MKIKPAKKAPESIKMRTRSQGDDTSKAMMAQWWLAEEDEQLAGELCGVAAFLKQEQQYRIRQQAVNVRLYCGLSVYSYAGSNVSKFDKSKSLPDDRPTFNLIQSAIDTLVARISQNEPSPRFLTDGADYRKRHLAKELNHFIAGEFYQTKAYVKGLKAFRDGLVGGTGCLKVYRGVDDKVAIDRVMEADLFCDDNDALNGQPKSLYQLKLVDRDVLLAANPDAKKVIDKTPNSYPDNSADQGITASDQVMVVEGWKLPTGDNPDAPGYQPGRHTIATTSGVIFDEEWTKTSFPFVFFNYSDPFLGFWGQGIAAQLFGTQISINRIMYTISRAINLVGVPRVFIENSSKVVKTHNNNEIGVLINYTGTKPSYEVAPCNAPELYAERDKLIEYGYRQVGVSDMQATAKKPSGLNSGEAIRSYDDINSDRFAPIAKRYEQMYIDLAYHVVDVAMDIAKDTGKYQTVYPNKDGTKEISLPQMGFLKDPFVIQCFTESMLPRTPAGRIATVTEMVQAGMLSLKEGRRLMKAPDLEDNERLDNAAEERIFQILDKIVEDGKFTPPDPFIYFPTALELTTSYINLYRAADLEQEKDDMLVDFFNQCLAMQTPPAPETMAPAGGPPPANPMPAPVSPLVPNTNAPPIAA